MYLEIEEGGGGGEEVVVVGVVETEHHFGGSSGAFFLEAVSGDFAGGGVVFEDSVEGLRIAVEVGDDWSFGAEELFESVLRKWIVMRADGIITEGGDADEAEVKFGMLFLQFGESSDGLASGDVASGCENKIGVVGEMTVFVVKLEVVAGEAKDGSAAIFELEVGMVGINPARFVGFVERDKIDRIGGIQGVGIGGAGGDVVGREEAGNFARAREECGDKKRSLVGETIMVLAPTSGSAEEVNAGDGWPGSGF